MLRLGHANPDGFHLRTIATAISPWPSSPPVPNMTTASGFEGVIATVLDCHGAAVVMWEAAQHGWQAAPAAPVPFITADFKVQFLRPTPLGETVRLTATPVTLDNAADGGSIRPRSGRQATSHDDSNVETVPPAG